MGNGVEIQMACVGFQSKKLGEKNDDAELLRGPEVFFLDFVDFSVER